MIDMHCHILPGVDDGAVDMDQSLSMVKLYIQGGYSGAVVTPHLYSGYYDTDWRMLSDVLDSLREAIRYEGLTFDLYPGNEFYLDYSIMESLRSGRGKSMNGSRYVLIEFPMNSEPLYAEDLCYNVALQGYVPIIAHGERYSYVQKRPEYLLKFVKKGYPVQINLHSLTGVHGKESQRTAIDLLEKDLVHLVGSDAHSDRGRSPDMREALTALQKIVGDEKYYEITEHNGNCVVQNKGIRVSVPGELESKVEEQRPKKNFFSRLFGKK